MDFKEELENFKNSMIDRPYDGYQDDIILKNKIKSFIHDNQQIIIKADQFGLLLIMVGCLGLTSFSFLNAMVVKSISITPLDLRNYFLCFPYCLLFL